MKPLDDDHSRMLFFDRIFGSEKDCPEEFKQVSCGIVEICGGLPLATASIASILANQPAVSVDLLTHIRDSLSSCLPSESTLERTRQVLNLSYNNLPRYLKTCLLYLSMYPEGSIIFMCDLVKQWAAEGFILTVEGQSMEEIAGNYFDELVDRRFIQPIYDSYSNEVVSCTVHDVVRDLIAHKSSEENFTVVVDQNRKNMTLSMKVHRLSVCFGDAKYAKIPSSIRKSRVRSLGFFGFFVCLPYIGEFKILRVLNLGLSHRYGNQDLSGISELLHLRYLKIASDRDIKLPNRMRALLCLETLDLKDTPSGTAVPWDIIYLPRLLHLGLPFVTNLLDRDVINLNQLQNLYIAIDTAHTHHHLRRRMNVLSSFVGGQRNLKTIVVSHGSSVKNTEVRDSFEALSSSWNSMVHPTLLERFEFLPCILSEVPRWMGQLGNLCILKIAVQILMSSCVEILSGLPALTALSLYVQRAPYEKIIFDKPAGFLVLKYFKLRFNSGIAWLKFEADTIPNLWKLKLVFNGIPQMDQKLYLFTQTPEVKQYQHGTAIINIEHMPGIREISAKFVGAAADLEYFSRIGVISNHPSNPTIDVQLVDSGSHRDRSTTQKQQPENILEGKLDEHNKTLEIPADKRISPMSPGPSSRQHILDGGQQHVGWSNMIDRIGRELFIHCLVQLSRSDYDSVASLNHDFYSLVRTGHIYRLRRKNGMAEHWVYLSCNWTDWVAYDPYRKRWIQVPRMPPGENRGIAYARQLCAGTELFLLDEAEFRYRYSILTNSWTRQANGLNTPRSFFGSASDGQKAYVAGGTDSEQRELRSAEMYDSETRTWIPLPSMNRARTSCAGALMDSKFYVIGGARWNNHQRVDLTCGEEYDLKRRSWKVIENMADGISAYKPLVAVVNNELYTATASHHLKKYDKMDGTWITLGNLPEQYGSIGGRDIGFLACGDRLIVLGCTGGMVELHSWIPDDQPPVWTLFASRRSALGLYHSAVMSC